MQPHWQAVWRSPARPSRSPEGHSLFGSGLGVSRVPKGESRGAQPHWQAVWRMCLHKPASFLYCPPFLEGRGPGGWSEPPLRQQSRKPESRECRPLEGSGSVPQRQPYHRRGSPEGCNPPGRRYGGCASINLLLFFICPLPSRKGARGMVRATIEATSPKPESRECRPLEGSGSVPQRQPYHRRGSPEGHSPTGRRYGGCASINLLLFFICPLPSRKGARGMVRATLLSSLTGLLREVVENPAEGPNGP